jgi:uncharacterized integral membrane protein
MELEEMQSLWDDMNQKPVKQKGSHLNISNMTQLKYNKKAYIFKVGEIMGLLVAYTFAGIILYKFNTLDKWYLIICGIILVMYLLVMPLYTIAGIIRMKKIDLAKSSYKEVMEHFYSVKSRLKQTEKISFIASPFIFVASMVILTKIFTDIDFFALTFQLPMMLLIVLSFTGAILFNIWAFKKRVEQLQSVKQLLEEDNQSEN